MEICNYEIAKKLKEKGFDKECLAYYTEDTEFYYNTCCGSDVESAFKSFNSKPDTICGKRIDAPTISQVLKWLRKEKEIIVLPIYYRNTSWWTCVVFTADSLEPHDLPSLSNSYEQAALAGIEYVIDNLI